MAFNHEIAQKYELQSHINWLKQDDNYRKILADIEDSVQGNKVKPHYLDMFFKGDLLTFNEFYKDVENKTVMEIAGGICGVLPLWNNWLKGRKISVDPLIDQCDEWLQMQGKTWFNGIELWNHGAEIMKQEGWGIIDGFILWRNGFDHMDKGEEAIENTAAYAAKGCKLYFWSDIKHLGEADEGHHSVVETPEEMEKMIEKYGWKLLYRTPNIHSPLQFVEYGGVFIKE